MQYLKDRITQILVYGFEIHRITTEAPLIGRQENHHGLTSPGEDMCLSSHLTRLSTAHQDHPNRFSNAIELALSRIDYVMKG